MAADVDTFLLDHVFQPAVDRLCGVSSCFDLAKLALAAAAALQLVALSGDLLMFEGGVERAMAGAATVLALFGADQTRALIRRAERQARGGHMNVRRITLRWQRLAWLVVSLWALGAGLVNLTLADVAAALAALAWVSTIYFVSCSPREPTRRTVFRFATAASHA